MRMAEEKHDEHEFELIPVSPLRRLEKRLDEMEKKTGFDTGEFYKELVDIIRLNQQLVDELAKANDALRIELSRLPARIENMTEKLSELVTFIKASATEGESAGGSDMKPLYEKISELVDVNKKIAESNQALLESLEEAEKRMKRPALPPPPMLRKPLLPPRPI